MRAPQNKVFFVIPRNGWILTCPECNGPFTACLILGYFEALDSRQKPLEATIIQSPLSKGCSKVVTLLDNQFGGHGLESRLKLSFFLSSQFPFLISFIIIECF